MSPTLSGSGKSDGIADRVIPQCGYAYGSNSKHSHFYYIGESCSKKDAASEKYYKQLCIDELTWCRKHSDIIINKANCLYKLCTQNTNYKGKKRCLDFLKLESACEKYNSHQHTPCSFPQTLPLPLVISD